MPHQQTFMSWLIDRALGPKVGICVDTMGLGKTHEILSGMLALDYLDAKLNQSSPKPILLVVPHNASRLYK